MDIGKEENEMIEKFQKELEQKDLLPGVYRIYWESNGHDEICVLGQHDSGNYWIASPRWKSGSLPLSSCKKEIVKIEHLFTEGPLALDAVLDTLKTHTKTDAINPDHYKKYPVETIDMMLRIFGPTATYWHCILTSYKYRMRLGHKDAKTQELQKEEWYLNKAAEIKSDFPNEIK